MTIRTKLVLLLTVPLLALLGVAGLAVSSAVDRAALADEAVELADQASGPGDVTRALAAERAATVRLSRGLADDTEMEEVRRATDLALQQGLSDLAATTDAEQAAYAPALSAYTQLGEIRDGVSAGTVSAATAWDFYSAGIELVLDGNRFSRSQVEIADLRTGLDRLDLVERAIDADAAFRATLDAIIEQGVGPSIEDRSLLASLATARSVRLDDAGVESVDLLAVDGALEEVLAAAPGEPLTLDTDALVGASRSAEAALFAAATEVQDQLLADADEVRSEARNQQLLALAGAVVVVLTAIGFVFVATRSIGRPLRRLTAEATSIADERLPAAMATVRAAPLGEDIELPELPPVATNSEDEIGQVGGAVDRLQHVALDLAVEQAVLRHNVSDSLLNLARRTQNLVGRQLDALTDLEQEETDPDALERLFEIDHLATRIRRHAESLIVLTGTDTARVRGDAASIGDVLRAALGEVEDYQRVEFGPVDDAVLHGHAVADLAHLLAELLENGLQFSPPEQPVGIVGRLSDDVYRIAIVDCGIGLTDEELSIANARLVGEELPTVAPSRYLGLYVAARLAKRLGASVRLSRAATGGVLADVLVPRRLVLDEGRAGPLVLDDATPFGDGRTDDVVVDGSGSPVGLPAPDEVLSIPAVPDPLPFDPAAVVRSSTAAVDPLPGRTDEPVVGLSPDPAPAGEGIGIADLDEPVVDEVADAVSEYTGELPRRTRRSASPEHDVDDREVSSVLEPEDLTSDDAVVEPLLGQEGTSWESSPVVESDPELGAADADGEVDEDPHPVDAADEAPSDPTWTDENDDLPVRDGYGSADVLPTRNGNGNGNGHGGRGGLPSRNGNGSSNGHGAVGTVPAPTDDEEPTPTEPPAGGLTRRVRGAQLRESAGRFEELQIDEDALATRDADSVRDMLSRFSEGVQRGRGASDALDEEQSDV